MYDMIILGSGPAGLSGAIFAAQRGLRVLVLESGAFGGLLASLLPEKVVLNYPGLSGRTAGEIAKLMLEEAKALGIELKKERVLEITKEKKVVTAEGEYEGRTILIATGARPRELGVRGEAEYNYGDRGVYYYVTEPKKFAGKKVLVVGGGNSAVEAAIELSDIAGEITLVHRRDRFRAIETYVEKAKSCKNVKILLNTELEEIKGSEERVESAVLFNNKTGEKQELQVDAVVLAIGLVPNSEIFQKLGLALDVEGRIVADANQKTSVSGVYAAGDIVSGTGKMELIVIAVAQGAIAAHNAYLELYQI